MIAYNPLVFIVDENEAARFKLVPLIRSAGWVPVCVGSVEEFLERPAPEGPGCLILDFSRTLLDGAAFRKLVEDRPEIPVVFTSPHRDVELTVRAMKSGAIDFLIRPFVNEAILSAIRAAVERSRQLLLSEAAVRSLRARYSTLSVREREVLGLVVSGLLNKQIGAELGITEITVKAHRGKLMRKMAAASLAELVNMAGRLRLTATTFSASAGAWPRSRGGVSRLTGLAATLTGARSAC